MTLIVKPGVLIPRPETEELVSLIFNDNCHRKFETFSILDACSGSGCIGLALKSAFSSCEVSMIDNSESAIEIARENAALNNLNVHILKMDIFEKGGLDNLPSFNLIASNPPYVLNAEKELMEDNVLMHEPQEALFVPDDNPLLYYEAIADLAWQKLVRPGFLYFEINEKYGSEIKRLLLNKGFEKVEVFKDIHGKDRFVRAEAKAMLLDTSYWHVEH